jgi:hypothetical protein
MEEGTEGTLHSKKANFKTKEDMLKQSNSIFN